MNKQKKMLLQNYLLIILVLVIGVGPLVFMKRASFKGSDDKASDMIQSIDSNYRPWFKPVWEPPSTEIESLLFALQASLGAGFIGYFIGLAKGRSEK